MATKERITKICVGCGSAFLTPPYKPNTKFCNPACMGSDETFLSKIKKAEGCWIWTGCIHHDGYGRWKSRGAHRHSFVIHKGPIPDGMVVMHSCDNRVCVNPSHLSLGRIADNVLDAVSKGRNAKGERIGAAKLTAEQVMEVRALHASGVASRKIGSRFGVSKTTVMDIVNGKYWRHVE